MAPALKPKDTGKQVVTNHGHVVGVVERIHGGAAYIRPVPGLLTAYGSWITAALDETESFRLNEDVVTEVSSDSIVIGPEEAGAPRPKKIY